MSRFWSRCGVWFERFAYSFAAALAVMLVTPATGQGADATGRTPERERWSWNRQQARVTETGDLAWSPEPFRLEVGDSVRYIDFAAGDDANDGSREKPWKHHPWDAAAAGNAKACEGIQTYIFKRGVEYRGRLQPDESGMPGNPIRLTSEASWGEGEAIDQVAGRMTPPAPALPRPAPA